MWKCCLNSEFIAVSSSFFRVLRGRARGSEEAVKTRVSTSQVHPSLSSLYHTDYGWYLRQTSDWSAVCGPGRSHAKHSTYFDRGTLSRDSGCPKLSLERSLSASHCRQLLAALLSFMTHRRHATSVRRLLSLPSPRGSSRRRGCARRHVTSMVRSCTAAGGKSVPSTHETLSNMLARDTPDNSSQWRCLLANFDTILEDRSRTGEVCAESPTSCEHTHIWPCCVA